MGWNGRETQAAGTGGTIVCGIDETFCLVKRR